MGRHGKRSSSRVSTQQPSRRPALWWKVFRDVSAHPAAAAFIDRSAPVPHAAVAELASIVDPRGGWTTLAAVGTLLDAAGDTKQARQAARVLADHVDDGGITKAYLAGVEHPTSSSRHPVAAFLGACQAGDVHVAEAALAAAVARGEIAVLLDGPAGVLQAPWLLRAATRPGGAMFSDLLEHLRRAQTPPVWLPMVAEVLHQLHQLQPESAEGVVLDVIESVVRSAIGVLPAPSGDVALGSYVVNGPQLRIRVLDLAAIVSARRAGVELFDSLADPLWQRWRRLARRSKIFDPAALTPSHVLGCDPRLLPEYVMCAVEAHEAGSAYLARSAAWTALMLELAHTSGSVCQGLLTAMDDDLSMPVSAMPVLWWASLRRFAMYGSCPDPSPMIEADAVTFLDSDPLPSASLETLTLVVDEPALSKTARQAVQSLIERTLTAAGEQPVGEQFDAVEPAPASPSCEDQTAVECATTRADPAVFAAGKTPASEQVQVPAGAQQVDLPAPVSVESVKVLWFGGNETQAAYLAELDDRIAKRFGSQVSVEWVLTGWSSNWGPLLAQASRQMGSADVCVMMRFVRTELGRALRKEAGRAGVPWVACSGHGKAAMFDAVVRAVDLAVLHRQRRTGDFGAV